MYKKNKLKEITNFVLAINMNFKYGFSNEKELRKFEKLLFEKIKLRFNLSVFPEALVSIYFPCQTMMLL